MSEVETPTTKSRSWLWWSIGGLGTLLVAYLALFLAVGSGIPSGTKLGELNLGRLSTSQAADVVAKFAQEFSKKTVSVDFSGETITTSPQELDLSVSVGDTVARIPQRSLNPIQLLTTLLSGNVVEPAISVGPGFDAALTNLVGDSETPTQNANIKYVDGQMVVVPAIVGEQVSRSDAQAAFVAGGLAGFEDPVVLALVEMQPQVSDSDAQTLIEGRLARLVGQPVTITVTDKPELSNTFSVENLKRSIRFKVIEGELTPFLLPGVLASKCDETFLAATQPVQDATWKIVAGKPVVVPAKSGFGVSDQSLATAVESVWDLEGIARTAQVSFGALDPELTTAAIEGLGVKELISSYTQNFPSAAYRSQNIGQAAEYIDGTLLMPGDTFSMNDTIKERTEANGYTSGWIIGSGGVFRYEPGGGVSTATTAMFNGAWFAGLKFEQWRAHSIFISRYPAGREATVSWGSLDMRFTNNYETAVFITTKMTSTSISVYFWGTKHWDEVGSVSGRWKNLTSGGTVYNSDENCHSQSPVPGFDITVFRTFLKAGVEEKRESYTTRYRATPKVICAAGPTPTKTKTTKPTKTKTPSPSVSHSDTSSATPTDTSTSG